MQLNLQGIMKQYLLLLSGLLFGNLLIAQVDQNKAAFEDENRPELIKNLQINQDPGLEEMLNRHIENNRIDKRLEGFRVEIFFSSDSDAKDQALKKKVEFLTAYPSNTVHVKYIAPNFRVRVGDFRTKNEALKLYKEIKNNYPVAFIVPDFIDFPPTKQEKNE